MSNYTHVTANGSTLTVDEALAYAERNGVHKPSYMSLEDAAAYVRENYPQFSDLTLHIGNPDFEPESETTTAGVSDARGYFDSGLRALGYDEVADSLGAYSDEEFTHTVSAAVHGVQPAEVEEFEFGLSELVAPREITVSEFIVTSKALREVL